MYTWEIITVLVIVAGFVTYYMNGHPTLWTGFKGWRASRLALAAEREKAHNKRMLIEKRWLLNRHLEEYAEIEQELRSLPDQSGSTASIRSNRGAILAEERDVQRGIIYKLRAEIEWCEHCLGMASDTPPPADKREALQRVRVDITHLRLEEERLEQELIEERGGAGPHRKQARIPTDD